MSTLRPYHPGWRRLCPSASTHRDGFGVKFRDELDSGIEFASVACMPSKSFLDGSGMRWRIWSTVPVSGAVINSGFEKGWLTFESEGGSLRRLAPIPSGWEHLSDDGLVTLLRQSNEVPRHTGPMQRIPRPETERDSRDGR